MPPIKKGNNEREKPKDQTKDALEGKRDVVDKIMGLPGFLDHKPSVGHLEKFLLDWKCPECQRPMDIWGAVVFTKDDVYLIPKGSNKENYTDWKNYSPIMPKNGFQFLFETFCTSCNQIALVAHTDEDFDLSKVLAQYISSALTAYKELEAKDPIIRKILLLPGFLLHFSSYFGLASYIRNENKCPDCQKSMKINAASVFTQDHVYALGKDENKDYAYFTKDIPIEGRIPIQQGFHFIFVKTCYECPVRIYDFRTSSRDSAVYQKLQTKTRQLKDNIDTLYAIKLGISPRPMGVGN